MLIFSEERLVPTDVNMLVIRGEEAGGYFYIHRALYDQAVVIQDIYGEDPEQLIKAITGTTQTRPDVDAFLITAPSPINMLGPFLLLVKQELESFVDMVGAIHVMSGPMHLRKMLKVPYEMRNSVPNFSLSIKEEYKLAWDRFFLNTIPYSDNMLLGNNNMAMNGANTHTAPVEEDEVAAELGFDPTELVDMGDGTMIPRDQYELLFNCGGGFFSDIDIEDDETEGEETTEVAVDEVEEVEVPEVVEVVPEPEPPKKVTGVDALLQLA